MPIRKDGLKFNFKENMKIYCFCQKNMFFIKKLFFKHCFLYLEYWTLKTGHLQ